MKNFVCSICNKDTSNVDNGYVEGCGQLCEKCYNMGTDREQMLVPTSIVKNTSNDAELGAKVRRLYWESR